VKKFYEAHKNDTRFAFIEFPIKGENSTEAAKAAIAARRQPEKYLAFHFALMNEHELVTPELVFAVAKKTGLDVAKLKADMADPAIEAEIDAAHALARKAGVDGTPTFIINGKVRPGAIETGMLEKLAKG
jgi:protein-disulfide isomerase